MKRFNLVSVVVAIVVTTLLISSCKSENGDYQLSNQEFVNKTSSVSAFQIAAGNLAKTKGSSDQVKQFGNKMITEYTAYKDELGTLARSKGWSTSDTMQPDEVSRLNTLNNLSGTAFDDKYGEIMVSSNQESLDRFTTASGKNGVYDGDLRNYAQNKLPYLKSFVQEAGAL